MTKKQEYKKFMDVEAGEEHRVDTDSFGNLFSAEAGCILVRDIETSGEEILQEEAKNK